MVCLRLARLGPWNEMFHSSFAYASSIIVPLALFKRQYDSDRFNLQQIYLFLKRDFKLIKVPWKPESLPVCSHHFPDFPPKSAACGGFQGLLNFLRSTPVSCSPGKSLEHLAGGLDVGALVFWGVDDGYPLDPFGNLRYSYEKSPCLIGFFRIFKR